MLATCALSTLHSRVVDLMVHADGRPLCHLQHTELRDIDRLTSKWHCELLLQEGEPTHKVGTEEKDRAQGAMRPESQIINFTVSETDADSRRWIARDE